MKTGDRIPVIFALIIVFVYSSELWSRQANTDLATLRTAIHKQTEDLDSLMQSRSELMREFSTVTTRINEFKIELENHRQPITEYRLNNALKNTHELADQIASLDRKINLLKKNLQKLNNNIIMAIDAEIDLLLKTSESSPPKKEALNQIQALSKEKSEYLELVNSTQIQVAEWQNINLEPEDSIQRINLKLSLLKDKAAKLSRVISQSEGRLEEYEKNYKMQKEMLGFYLDLSRSVEDEQGIFDRNRLDEMNDQIEILTKKIEIITEEIAENRLNFVHLQAKIDLFSLKLREKNDKY